MRKSIVLREKFAKLETLHSLASSLEVALMLGILNVLKESNLIFEADPCGVEHTITDLDEYQEDCECPMNRILTKLWFDKEKGKLVCECKDGTTTDNFKVNDLPYLAEEIIELEKDSWIESAELDEEEGYSGEHFAEIKSDYTEETENGDFTYVDAWKTDSDDEEGHSIAKVNRQTKEVIWLDERYKNNAEINEEIAVILDEIDLEKDSMA